MADRKSDSTQLKIAGAWLQALSDGSHEVVALFDEAGALQYLSMSGAVQAILGYEALEIMAMSPPELLHPQDAKRVLDGFRTVAAHPGGRMTLSYRARHSAGHYVMLESTAVNRINHDFVHAIVVHTREELGAVGQPVTNMPPPPELGDDDDFAIALTEALTRARTGHYGFSVMMMQVERLDQVVEQYGDDTANALLVEAGRRLHSLLRPGDTLAELKSRRFAILLDAVEDRALAERIAARIQKTVGNHFNVGGHEINSDTTVGLVTSDRLYDHAADVMRDATVATSQARDTGTNRRAVYRTQMHIQKSRHMSLMAELHNALNADQFRVYYLPIVGLATRTISGFEALVRWEHPERGVIGPDVFLSLAEETGLIAPLGRWVMETACEQMAQWHKRYAMDSPLTLSVNLSARQFSDYDLHDQVAEVLDTTGLNPLALTLEVHEQAVFEYRDAVTDALSRVRKHGVKISIDNFGIGSSSFVYLHQLRYDRLKIDRTLVQPLAAGGRGRDLVHALVGLAHNLAMEVVAEGVETPGQAAQLSKMWCEYAQGYLFGKPMDADGAGALLASYPRWWE